jgi:hypothetical protein
VVVVFYVSGHGLGHASRDINVIHALRVLKPGARVIVRTSAPRWIFEAAAPGVIELQPCEADTGVAQLDSLRIDEEETARRAAAFYANFDARVEAEARVLRDLEADIVVGDVPPLAFAAARGAALPSVALANFTWDWIYAAHPRFEQRAPGVLDTIRQAYAQARLALRLPMHGGFDAMAGAVRDIPLVARRSKLGRREARRALNFSDERPIVLASFGAHGLALPYRTIAAEQRFTLVVTDKEAEPDEARGAGLRRLHMEEMAARGVQYEDLVAAADVVVSKPGYGIVSDCIANGAALLYASRRHFIEHDMFVREMPRVLRCRHIERDRLLEGRWAEDVEALVGQEQPSRRLAVDGALAAATAILSVDSGRPAPAP